MVSLKPIWTKAVAPAPIVNGSGLLMTVTPDIVLIWSKMTGAEDWFVTSIVRV